MSVTISTEDKTQCGRDSNCGMANDMGLVNPPASRQ